MRDPIVSWIVRVLGAVRRGVAPIRLAPDAPPAPGERHLRIGGKLIVMRMPPPG